MKTLAQVVQDIKKLRYTKDFKNAVIYAFNDYCFKGTSIVVVNELERGFKKLTYVAYIDKVNSPRVYIEIEDGINLISDVWILG